MKMNLGNLSAWMSGFFYFEIYALKSVHRMEVHNPRKK